MLYNEIYINKFKEEDYLNFLNNPEKLSTLKNSYLNQYNSTPSSKVEAIDILFKESLEHYLLRKILNDPSEVKKTTFENYINFFVDIYNANELEMNTNILFRNKNIRDMIINAYFTKHKAYLEKNYDTYNSKCDNIINKMEQNQTVTLDDLNFVCEYISKLRAFNLKENEIIIKYIFSNIENQNIKFTYQVQSFILNYLPYFYDSNDISLKNTRIILCDTNRKKDIMGPGSAHGDYIVMNKLYFNDVSHTIEDSKFERLKKGKDFTYLIMVMFHELTHIVQSKNIHSKDFDNQAMGMILKKLNNDYLNDYLYNHNSNETEIDANYNSWVKSAEFYNKFYVGKNRDNLISNCLGNRNTARFRRIFSLKKDKNGILSPYSIYDIENLISIVYHNPKLVCVYPMLEHFFDKRTGNIDCKYMYNLTLYTESTGKEFINYFFKNNGKEEINKILNFQNFNNNQLNNLIGNMYYFVCDCFRNIENLERLKVRGNMGEYNDNPIKTIDDYDILELNCYNEAIKYYQDTLQVFNNIYNQYPNQKKYIEQCKDSMNKVMLKFYDVINNKTQNSNLKFSK